MRLTKQNYMVTQRNSSGQALVEGVAALILIVIASILATLFMVNSGLATYYKEKLGFITNQAASFAFQLPRTADPTGPTTDFVNNLCTEIGLPASGISVKANNTINISGKPAVIVTVTANCKIFGKDSIFPVSIPMSDTTAAIQTNYVVSGPAGPPGPTGATGAPGASGGSGGGFDQVIQVSNAMGGPNSSMYIPVYSTQQMSNISPFTNFGTGQAWSMGYSPGAYDNGISLQSLGNIQIGTSAERAAALGK